MGVYEAYGRLAAQLQGGVLADERMHRHTSYRIGGPAALFITCDSYADLRVANAVLREEGVPWVIMGRATAADVTKVIVHVMNEVRGRHGVELRPEVKFLGFPA